MAPPVIPMELKLYRLIDHYDEVTGCWVGRGTAHGGRYVRIALGGANAKSIPAHAWAYEHWVGPVPEGLELDHLCERTRCINPWHVEAVTHQENCRRRSARVKACPSGHLYAPENVRMYQGKRCCRECARLRARGWRPGMDQTLYPKVAA